MSESSTAHATTAWPHPESDAARASTRWAADGTPDADRHREERGSEGHRRSS